MPATYTHHAFTLDVYKTLNDDVKEKLALDIDTFNLFGKSFDALLFGDLKLGVYAHNNNVNLYFKNIIQYIRDNNLYDDTQVLAYLYGSICHYVLDSVAHPYIYYKSGKHDVNDKSTYKYKGKHDQIEFMIDAIIYQERNDKPIYKVNVGKKVFTKIKFNSNLKNIIDYAYLNTFGVNNGYRVYN
ncbi:MAG: zinc dependent phospholipase C family protein, partial [Bacilli bacterium]|nr:zinc dependent phospholipase C family protein [Bacilli bacterium]